MFGEENLEKLRERVAKMISGKRFAHTLGVERATALIGKHCLPDRISELRIAAILHDVTKEFTPSHHIELMNASDRSFTDDDYAASAVHHSFSGPEFIKSAFSEYATPDILRAVFNHTLGAPLYHCAKSYTKALI